MASKLPDKLFHRPIRPALLLTFLTGLNLFNYIDRFLLNGVLVPIQQEFALSDTQLGRLNTAFMIGYFLTSPLFGYLGDRSSRKLLIALGVGVASIGTIATSFVASFAGLLLFRILVGLGEASYASVSPSLISDAYHGRARNTALSIFYIGLPVGAALGYILSGQLHEVIGWRGAFLWVGICSLLLAFILQPFAEPKRGALDGQSGYHPPRKRDVLRLVKNRKYLICLLGYIFYTFSFGALSVWAPVFLHRYHGQSNADATLFFGAVAVLTGISGTLIGGLLASRYRTKSPVAYEWLLFLSTLAAVPAIFYALLGTELILVQLGFALAMFFLFMSTGPVNTVILEAVPVNLRASAMALSIFSIHLFGDLWSPEFVGFVSSTSGSLQKALLILPFGFLICAWFWALGARQNSRLHGALP